MARLVDFELAIGHRADGGGNGLVYELAWSGEGVDGRRFLIGLTSPDQLAETGTTTPDRSGQTDEWSGPGRPPVGGQSAPSRTTTNGTSTQLNDHEHDVDAVDGPERAVPEIENDARVVVEQVAS